MLGENLMEGAWFWKAPIRETIIASPVFVLRFVFSIIHGTEAEEQAKNRKGLVSFVT